MIESIKNILGIGSKVNLKELILNGAQVIDVRSKEEYRQGHIPSSINIPLQDLSRHISKLQKDKPVITCCASGMRSASAKSILASKGIKEVHNGGGWLSLQNKIK